MTLWIMVAGPCTAGGASAGADRAVEIVAAAGGAVYRRIDDVPHAPAEAAP